MSKECILPLEVIVFVATIIILPQGYIKSRHIHIWTKHLYERNLKKAVKIYQKKI